MSLYQTGFIVQFPNAFYALRDSDLPLLSGGRYTPLWWRRDYATPDIGNASVWRYRTAAETWRDKYAPDARIPRAKVLQTGYRTNDGRVHYRVVSPKTEVVTSVTN
tara:strand:- start:711 stop:1028 length:318 start_codon:yes stop_codon:yes gene_type:complete